MLIIRQYYKRESGRYFERNFLFQKFHSYNNRQFTRTGMDGSSTEGAWDREDIHEDRMNGHIVLPFILEIEYTTP